MRYTVLSDSESPFTAVAYWGCPGGVRGTETPACKQDAVKHMHTYTTHVNIQPVHEVSDSAAAVR